MFYKLNVIKNFATLAVESILKKIGVHLSSICRHTTLVNNFSRRSFEITKIFIQEGYESENCARMIQSGPLKTYRKRGIKKQRKRKGRKKPTGSEKK